MSKMNSIPVIVQQTIESMLDSHTPEHVKFNNKVVLENIIDCCTIAIQKYNNKRK